MPIKLESCKNLIELETFVNSLRPYIRSSGGRRFGEDPPFTEAYCINEIFKNH